MKNSIATLLVLLTSTSAFASAQLICKAEDGSQVQASINSSNDVSDVRIQVRESNLTPVPGIQTVVIDTEKSAEGELVRKLVLADKEGNLVVVVSSGSYTDSSGTYSVERCEIAY